LMMREMGIGLMIAGGLLVMLGALLLGVHHLFGRMPLDFVWEGKHWKVVFPLGTSLLLSLLLTLGLNLLLWLFLRR